MSEVDYQGKEELAQLEALPRYNDWIARMLVDPITPGSRVADFGAGLGAIADRLVDDHDVVCIEVDPTLTAALLAKGHSVVSGATDIEQGSLAGVVSSNVLEHIEDDVAVLRELRDALRPGGFCTMFVPAFTALWTPLDDRVGHLRRYTRDSLGAAFEAAGFEVVHSRYADSLGAVLAFAFKFIGSSDGSLKHWQLVLFDRVALPISRLMDLLLSRWVGKNVYLVARRPDA